MTPGADMDIADDHILDNQILRGIMAIRIHLNCSLHEALRAFTDRYKVPREHRPDDFTCGPDEYWVGFYS